jgi:hypothetical protein
MTDYRAARLRYAMAGERLKRRAGPSATNKAAPFVAANVFRRADA